MNNLPENENIAETEEFSTVFSAPTQHKEVAKQPKNKRFKIALALFLAVAVLAGGTLAVIKLIPEKDDGNTSQSSEIGVLDYESDQIKELIVKNSNGKFKFYSKSEESEALDTGEAITVTSWYMDGYDEKMTDSDLIEQIVSDAVGIEAIREISAKSKAECGLEKPVATADITTLDGEKTTVLVGGKSPDNAGVYVCLENKDEIYLVSQSLDESLTFTDLDLASTEEQAPITLSEDYADYCSGETVISFDKLTVSGNDFEELVFVPNESETLAAFMPYQLVKPMKRAAENVDGVFSIFSSGFPVIGAYSYDASDKTIKALGLDKPDVVVSVVFDDLTKFYKFKKQSDGNYAVIGNDSKNVKKVSVSDCAFLGYETTDFYSQTIFLIPIDSVSNLTLKTQDKTYSFDIRENPKGDDIDKYIVECDGKTFKSSYFQSFYQYLCMMQCMEFDTEKTSAKPELSIIYTYNDKKQAPTKIEFVKTSAVRYQYSIDGVPMGKVGSSSYKKLFKNLERLLDGKQVVVN